MIIKIRIECPECLLSDSLRGEFTQADAEYRASIMCENLMGECGHNMTPFTVQLTEELRASELAYYELDLRRRHDADHRV